MTLGRVGLEIQLMGDSIRRARASARDASAGDAGRGRGLGVTFDEAELRAAVRAAERRFEAGNRGGCAVRPGGGAVQGSGRIESLGRGARRPGGRPARRGRATRRLCDARHALRAAPDLEEARETEAICAGSLWGGSEAARTGDRILVVVEKFHPSVGGTEVLAADLAVELARRGHPADVLCYEHPGDDGPAGGGSRCTRRRRRTPTRALRRLLGCGRVRRRHRDLGAGGISCPRRPEAATSAPLDPLARGAVRQRGRLQTAPRVARLSPRLRPRAPARRRRRVQLERWLGSQAARRPRRARCLPRERGSAGRGGERFPGLARNPRGRPGHPARGELLAREEPPRLPRRAARGRRETGGSSASAAPPRSTPRSRPRSSLQRRRIPA